MTDQQTTITLRTLRPFCGHGRATVSESPVDEIARESGLVVPLAFEGDDEVKRGVVLHVAYDPAYPARSEIVIDSGTVVFYRGGVRIAGTEIVDLEQILAYEDDE